MPTVHGSGLSKKEMRLILPTLQQIFNSTHRWALLHSTYPMELVGAPPIRSSLRQQIPARLPLPPSPPPPPPPPQAPPHQPQKLQSRPRRSAPPQLSRRP